MHESLGLEKLGDVDHEGKDDDRDGVDYHSLGDGVGVHQIPVEKRVANSDVPLQSQDNGHQDGSAQQGIGQGVDEPGVQHGVHHGVHLESACESEVSH